MESAVAYLRVSTQRQQRSGLGIEAQRATIARFAEAEGLTIIAEFISSEQITQHAITHRANGTVSRLAGARTSSMSNQSLRNAAEAAQPAARANAMEANP